MVKKKRKSISKATLEGLSKKIKPVFKKPGFTMIKGLSATRLIQQMAKESSGALVREIENKYANPEQDNRSLYFKEEFKSEKRKAFGGFL